MSIKQTFNSIARSVRHPVAVNPVFFLMNIVLLRPVVLTENAFEFGFSVPLLMYDLCCTVFVSYVLSSSLLISTKFFKGLWYLLTIILFLVSLFLSLTFGRIISPVTIQQFIETDSTEASEFVSSVVLSQKGILSIVITLAVVALSVFFEMKQNALKRFSGKLTINAKNAFSLSLVGVLTIGILSFRINPYNEAWKSVSMNSASLLYHAIPRVYDDDDIKKMIRISNVIATKNLPRAKTANDNLVVTVILGESLNKSHCSPYGYCHATMPFTDREVKHGNAFVFSDVVTPFNFTISCVKNIFFTNSLAKEENYCDTPFFPQLFRQSGFEVLMCDCQNNFYAEDSDISKIENGILHNPTLSRFSYDIEFKNISQYDRDNVDSCLSAHPARHTARLQIFHLKGQHDGASQRYPHVATYTKFSASDVASDRNWLNDDKKKHISEYDNAVLYNDFVINDILINVSELNSIVFFFPDHGEEVYDYRDSFLRLSPTPGLEAEWAQHQFGIPFVVYVSDTFKKLYPEKIDRIVKSTSVPFSTDVVSHMLLDIAEIRPFYNSALDPLSPNYVKMKRTISDSDGRYVFNYDVLTR